MPSLRHVAHYLHVLAAIFWVGEILFLGLVVGPYARTLDPEARRKLFQSVGRRSLPFAWGAMALLVVSGVINLVAMGIPLGDLFAPSFYRTSFGGTLGVKLLFVATMFATSAMHDIVLTRRARAIERALPGASPDEAQSLSAEYARYRRSASLLGRLNFLLALVVIYLATQLVTGP